VWAVSLVLFGGFVIWRFDHLLLHDVDIGGWFLTARHVLVGRYVCGENLGHREFLDSCCNAAWAGLR